MEIAIDEGMNGPITFRLAYNVGVVGVPLPRLPAGLGRVELPKERARLLLALARPQLRTRPVSGGAAAVVLRSRPIKLTPAS